MTQYNVNMYNVYSNVKSSLSERLIRTLKNKLWIQLDHAGNRKWISKIDDVVSTYNETKHSKIRTRPIDVNKENEREIFLKYFDYDNIDKNKFQKKILFQVGDLVRISKTRAHFDKAYLINWCYEVFRIRKVLLTDPVTYLIEDLKNEPIKGVFYNYELKKSKYPDIYLVDKIIRKKKGKLLVKFHGFPSEENMWIDKKDIM
jgi:hypothetical protein